MADRHVYLKIEQIASGQPSLLQLIHSAVGCAARDPHSRDPARATATPRPRAPSGRARHVTAAGDRFFYAGHLGRRDGARVVGVRSALQHSRHRHDGPRDSHRLRRASTTCISLRRHATGPR